MRDKAANVRLMQRMNRLSVFSCIRTSAVATRPALASETGLSLASITNIVSHLIRCRLVTEGETIAASGAGRRASALRVDRSFFRMICITVEPEDVRGTMVDLCAVPTAQTQCRPENPGSAAVERAIVQCVRRLMPSCAPDALAAVCVGVPGMVLADGDRVFSQQLGWRDYGLRTRLEGQLGVPVFVQNVTVARAMWVLSQAARGDVSFPTDLRGNLFLDLEGGIGAVQFHETGVNPWMLGEIGHTTVDIHAPLCSCGNVGCLESLCSPEVIRRDCGMDVSQAQQAAQQGNEHCRAVLTRCGRYLGAAMVTLIHLLRPGRIYVNADGLYDSAILAQTAQEWARQHTEPELTRELSYHTLHMTQAMVVEGLAEHALNCLTDHTAAHSILDMIPETEATIG